MIFIVIPKLGNYHRRNRFGQRIMTNSRNINLTQDYENGELGIPTYVFHIPSTAPHTHEPMGSATIWSIITSPHAVSEVIYTHFKPQSNKILR